MSNPEEVEKTSKVALDLEPIFALDIGTRSIIGIVGVPDGDLFKVLGVEIEEHSKRAMVDGQIEDIEQTAKVARIVKERLENSLGLTLKNVYVAAAGRALRTQEASFEIELNSKESIQDLKVFELEMGAIEEARRIVVESGGLALYCVGHSVTKYYLDDYPLSTLLNHKGSRAKVEIIATFLPNGVVESLYSAMEKTGLTVSNITLEPIAAMNAIIPNELRMLNLALVDVGAGTSDIAISDNGSVSAYTMATIAGDEITETIVRDFLVDFTTAERMKIDLSHNLGNIEYQDILGFSYSVSPSSIMEKVAPAIENLSSEICNRILEINEKAPAAVFLVGGGSQIPTLCQEVAQKLSVAENKVAVGGGNYMKRLVAAQDDIRGPEFATPMGIALTAMLSRARGSFEITVNGEKKHIFKNGALPVIDVLMISGYRQNQIIGRSGQSLTFELDGQKKLVRGSHPSAASIVVNGKAASISTTVQTGDVVLFEPAVQGEDARPLIQDMTVNWEPFQVSLNGVQVQAGSTAVLNGAPAVGSTAISNMDLLEIHRVDTLEALCNEAKIEPNQYGFLVNGTEQQENYLLAPDDDIRYFAMATQKVPAASCAVAPLDGLPPTEAVDASEVIEPPPVAEADTHRQEAAPSVPVFGALSAGDPANPGKVLKIFINHREVVLYPKRDGMPYQFLDMLNFVDIDTSKPQGNIILRINGKDASYLDEIFDQSRVEIRWEQEESY